MPKQAALHPLDIQYDKWWRHPMSISPTDDLIKSVRAMAMRQSRSEDIAQEVCLRVLSGLDTFVRSDSSAFSRWVRRLTKHVKLEQYRTHSHHTRTFDENSISESDDDSFVDISQLPNAIRVIAENLLQGYSLVEIAEMSGVSDAAIRNKLMRFRKRALRNTA